MPPLFTVGHGTMPADEFHRLVANAGIERVVDVRAFPGSRHNPQYGREAMEQWLPAAGVRYQWMPQLGGRRRPAAHSPHVALRNSSFRAYADYMDTPQFANAVDELLALAAAEPTAVMCSESVWWRCHRRLIADRVSLLAGCEVQHLMHDGRLTVHMATAGVRPLDGAVRYDVDAAPTLPLE